MSLKTTNYSQALVFQCLHGGRTFKNLIEFEKTLSASGVAPSNILESITRLRNDHDDVGHLVGLCASGPCGMVLFRSAVNRQILRNCEELTNVLRTMKGNGKRLDSSVRDIVQEWCLYQNPADLVLDPGLPDLKNLVKKLPDVEALNSKQMDFLLGKLKSIPRPEDFIGGLSWVEKNVASVWYIREHAANLFKPDEENLVQNERSQILRGSPFRDVFSHARGLTNKVLFEGIDGRVFRFANQLRTLSLPARLNIDGKLFDTATNTTDLLKLNDYIVDHLAALNFVLLDKPTSAKTPETQNTLALHNAYVNNKKDEIIGWVSKHGLPCTNETLLEDEIIAQNVAYRVPVKPTTFATTLEKPTLRMVLDLGCCSGKPEVKKEAVRTALKILQIRGSPASDIVIMSKEKLIVIPATKLDEASIINHIDGESQQRPCVAIMDAANQGLKIHSYVFLVGSNFEDSENTLRNAIQKQRDHTSVKSGLLVCWMSPRGLEGGLRFRDALTMEMDMNADTFCECVAFLDSLSIANTISQEKIDSMISNAACEEDEMGYVDENSYKVDTEDAHGFEEDTFNSNNRRSARKERSKNERASQKEETQKGPANGSSKKDGGEQGRIAKRAAQRLLAEELKSDDYHDGNSAGGSSDDTIYENGRVDLDKLRNEALNLEKSHDAEIRALTRELGGIKALAGPRNSIYAKYVAENEDRAKSIGNIVQVPNKNGEGSHIEGTGLLYDIYQKNQILGNLEKQVKIAEEKLKTPGLDKSEKDGLQKTIAHAKKGGKIDQAREEVKVLERKLSTLQDLQAASVNKVQGWTGTDDEETFQAKLSKISELKTRIDHLTQEKEGELRYIDQQIKKEEDRLGVLKKERDSAAKRAKEIPKKKERKQQVAAEIKKNPKTSQNTWAIDHPQREPLSKAEFENNKPSATSQKDEPLIVISEEKKKREQKEIIQQIDNAHNTPLVSAVPKKKKEAAKKVENPFVKVAKSNQKQEKTMSKLDSLKWGFSIRPTQTQLTQEQLEYSADTGGQFGYELAEYLGSQGIQKTVPEPKRKVVSIDDESQAKSMAYITGKFIPDVIKCLKEIPYHAWDLYENDFRKIFYVTVGKDCPELLAWDSLSTSTGYLDKLPGQLGSCVRLVVALKRLCQVLHSISKGLVDLLASASGFCSSPDPFAPERLRSIINSAKQLADLEPELVPKEEQVGEYSLFTHVFEVLHEVKGNHILVEEIETIIHGISMFGRVQNGMKAMEIFHAYFVMSLLMELLSIPAPVYDHQTREGREHLETLARILVKCDSEIKALEDSLPNLQADGSAKKCLDILKKVYRYIMPYRDRPSVSDRNTQEAKNFEERLDLEWFLESLRESMTLMLENPENTVDQIIQEIREISQEYLTKGAGKVEADGETLGFLVVFLKNFCKSWGLTYEDSWEKRINTEISPKFVGLPTLREKSTYLIEETSRLIEETAHAHPNSISDHLIAKILLYYSKRYKLPPHDAMEKSGDYLEKLGKHLVDLVEEVYKGAYGLELGKRREWLHKAFFQQQPHGNPTDRARADFFMKNVLPGVILSIVQNDLHDSTLVKAISQHLQLLATEVRKLVYSGDAFSEATWLRKIALDVVSKHEIQLEKMFSQIGDIPGLKDTVETLIDRLSVRTKQERSERLIQTRRRRHTTLVAELEEYERKLDENSSQMEVKRIEEKINQIQDLLNSTSSFGTPKDDVLAKSDLAKSRLFISLMPDESDPNRDLFSCLVDACGPLTIQMMQTTLVTAGSTALGFPDRVSESATAYTMFWHFVNSCSDASLEVTQYRDAGDFFEACRDLEVVFALFDPRLDVDENVISLNEKLVDCYRYIVETLNIEPALSYRHHFLEHAYTLSRPVIGTIPEDILAAHKGPTIGPALSNAKLIPTPAEVLQVVMLDLMDHSSNPLRLDHIGGCAMMKADAASLELHSLVQKLVNALQDPSFPEANKSNDTSILQISKEIKILMENHKPSGSEFLYKSLTLILSRVEAYYSLSAQKHPISKFLESVRKSGEGCLVDPGLAGSLHKVVVACLKELPQKLKHVDDAVNFLVQKAETLKKELSRMVKGPENSPKYLAIEKYEVLLELLHLAQQYTLERDEKWDNSNIILAFEFIGTLQRNLSFTNKTCEYRMWLKSEWDYWRVAFNRLYMNNATRYITRVFYSSIPVSMRVEFETIYHYFIGSHAAFERISYNPPMSWEKYAILQGDNMSLDNVVAKHVFDAYQTLKAFPYGDHHHVADRLRNFFLENNAFPEPFTDLEDGLVSNEAAETYSPTILYLVRDVTRCCAFHARVSSFIQKDIISVSLTRRNQATDEKVNKLNPTAYEWTIEIKNKYKSICNMFSSLSPRAQIMFRSMIDDAAAAIRLYGVIYQIVGIVGERDLKTVLDRFKWFQNNKDLLPSTFCQLTLEAQRLIASRIFFAQYYPTSRLVSDGKALERELLVQESVLAHPNNLTEAQYAKTLIDAIKKRLETEAKDIEANYEAYKLKIKTITREIAEIKEKQQKLYLKVPVLKQGRSLLQSTDANKKKEREEFITKHVFVKERKKQAEELAKKNVEKIHKDKQAAGELETNPRKLAVTLWLAKYQSEKGDKILKEFEDNPGNLKKAEEDLEATVRLVRWDGSKGALPDTKPTNVERSQALRAEDEISRGVSKKLKGLLDRYQTQLEGIMDMPEGVLEARIRALRLNGDFDESQSSRSKTRVFITKEDLRALYDKAIGEVERAANEYEEKLSSHRTIIHAFTHSYTPSISEIELVKTDLKKMFDWIIHYKETERVKLLLENSPGKFPSGKF